MSKETFNLIFMVLYLLVFLLFLIILGWSGFQKKKKSEAIKKSIFNKISSKIALSPKDIDYLAKAYGLSTFQARQSLYKLYDEAQDKEQHDLYRNLINEVEIEEPFDDLPTEVKPSMIRLTKIASETGEESDKFLLSPIVQTLNEYVELKSNQEKMKKQNTKAYIITVISFFFGLVSLYYTLTAPSAKDIAKEIHLLKEQNQTQKQF